MNVPIVKDTLGFAMYEDVLILVHGNRPPGADDWEDWVTAIREHSIGCRGILVVTPGVGPDELQRKALSDALGAQLAQVKTAVLTPSKLAAGITIALRWLGADIRAFPPHDYDDALDFLEVADAQRQVILMAAHNIHGRLN